MKTEHKYNMNKTGIAIHDSAIETYNAGVRERRVKDGLPPEYSEEEKLELIDKPISKNSIGEKSFAEDLDKRQDELNTKVEEKETLIETDSFSNEKPLSQELKELKDAFANVVSALDVLNEKISSAKVSLFNEFKNEITKDKALWQKVWSFLKHF